MEYVAVTFPPRISMGAQRRPGWKTTVVQTASGYEATNQDWSKARHTYDVSFAVRTATDYNEIAEHFYMVRGRAKKWRFKDPLDYQCSRAQGVLSDEGESPTVDYELVKRYGSGAHLYDRRITRPVAGTVVIYRLRGATTTDITGSSTIDYETGKVIIGPGVLQFGDIKSWSGKFDVPCRYDTDELPSLIVNRHPGTTGELLVQCESIPIVEVREG